MVEDQYHESVTGCCRTSPKSKKGAARFWREMGAAGSDEQPLDLKALAPKKDVPTFKELGKDAMIYAGDFVADELGNIYGCEDVNYCD